MSGHRLPIQQYSEGNRILSYIEPETRKDQLKPNIGYLDELKWVLQELN